jgi:hypothetical protein
MNRKLLVLGVASFVAAQEYRGTISGRIIDPQEAVIAGVKVVAVQVDTGTRFETVSGQDGLYTLPFLPPSQYRITAEASGFKRYQRDGVQVSSNDRVGLDIQLEVGQVTETVLVTGEAPILQTTTASSGQVISTRQIENMPVSGRTPLALAQLAFGVTPNDDPRFTRPFDNAGPSGFSMGGAPGRSNELLIDGAPDSTGNSRVAYNPPMDAVAEVKAESFQADAAYGHSGGGTVNIVTKSGTNSFHGTLYEFNQNSALNATPFFTNKAGGKKPVSRFNQWGGSFSGPIWIPKLVDGRNRLFFFFAYEGVKDALPAPATSTVPTPAERNGDFSSLPYQIWDPATGVREGNRVRRQPFPGNIIPSNRISSIARNYLQQFYPDPNQPGRPDGQDNFLSTTQGERNDFSNYIGRMDVNFSDRHKLSFNGRNNVRTGQGSNNLGKSLIDTTATNGLRRINWGFMADDVYTWSPTLIMNTRLNWTRFVEPLRNFSLGFDSTSLGFPAYLAQNATRPVLPRIRFSRFTGVGDNAGEEFPFDSFQIFESFTKILNKHTLKFGVDLRQYRESRTQFGFSNGDFLFGTNWTVGPLDNSAPAPLGQDLAAFLLGLPTDGAFDVNGSRTSQSSYYAFFLQDDYRVKSNLTLNVGLRVERETGTTERYDRSVNGFDMTTPSPISAAARAAYAANPIPEIPAGQFNVNGGLQFAGPSDREIYSTAAAYVSPRFGFAWTPGALGGNTVVRGGFGIYFFPYGVTGTNQPGFSQTTPVVASLDGFLTPTATLANPFPTGIQQPTGSSLGLATFLGRSITFFNPDAKSHYSMRGQFSIQREVARNLLVEVGYMYNKAVRLLVDQNINGLPLQYLSTSAVRDQANIDRMTANVPNPFAGLIPGTPLNGSTIPRHQLLRAFPQFAASQTVPNALYAPSSTAASSAASTTGVIAQNRSDGSSYFHALQVRVEQRFRSGLQFIANYQWSKLMEMRSRLNDLDPQLEKRIAAEDRPHRLVVSGTYDLPFGRGRAHLSSINRMANLAIGGWTINGIVTLQPGTPLYWGNVNGDNPNTFLTPIYLGGLLNIDPHRVDGAFDTSRFNRVPADQLEWNRRTFPTRFSNLRQDGVQQVDFSVIKAFQFTERFALTYRCEFFNATNRPIFSAPNRVPTSTNFGLITNQANQPRRIQMALRLVF